MTETTKQENMYHTPMAAKWEWFDRCAAAIFAENLEKAMKAAAKAMIGAYKPSWVVGEIAANIEMIERDHFEKVSTEIAPVSPPKRPLSSPFLITAPENLLHVWGARDE